MAHDQFLRGWDCKEECVACGVRRILKGGFPTYRTRKKGRRVTRADHMRNERLFWTGKALAVWRKRVNATTVALQQAVADFYLKIGPVLAAMYRARPLLPAEGGSG